VISHEWDPSNSGGSGRLEVEEYEVEYQASTQMLRPRFE